MARQDKSSRGRVTPKGTVPDTGRPGPTAGPANRTPVNVDPPSSVIVPVLMFATMIAGTAIILFNYVPHGLLGTPSNWYLLGGLGLILIGIIAATQYR